MWETVIAGVGGLMGLYVALRKEIRRSHELLAKDVGHLDGRLTQEVGHLDGRLTQAVGHLDGRLTQEVGHLDGRLTQEVGHLHEGVREIRSDIRRLDEKIDAVRGELIAYLGSR